MPCVHTASVEGVTRGEGAAGKPWEPARRDLFALVTVVRQASGIYPHAGGTRPLAQAGWQTFPDTYDDLLRLAKDLKQKKLPPIALTLGHAIFDTIGVCYACLWSFGGKEVEEDGKTLAINSIQTEAAVEYMKELYQYMDPSVLAGAIAVTNNAVSIYNVAKRDAPELLDKMNHTLPWQGPAGRFGGRRDHLLWPAHVFQKC